MTSQEIEEFVKSQRKWDEFDRMEYIWNEIHKNIKRRCQNCQNYPICLQEGTANEEACEDWNLSLKVFVGIVERYNQNTTKTKEK